jgi:hypothetical protein
VVYAKRRFPWGFSAVIKFQRTGDAQTCFTKNVQIGTLPAEISTVQTVESQTKEMKKSPLSLLLRRILLEGLKPSKDNLGMVDNLGI